MLNILDCTLRDGGYYNNWKFSPELVNSYLRAMEQCSVNYVELGFRFNTSDPSIGPFGRTSEEFLKTLDLPSSMKYALMINGKEFLDSDNEKVEELVNKNFSSAESSPISLVRIAINFDGALETRFLLSCIKSLGYRIGLNLMQSNGKNKEDYARVSKEIESWNLVDVLYFADSLGNMNSEEIGFIIESLKKGWKGELGFHSHNNKGFALSNSLTAIEKGVNYCDSTVTGMGRGAGNVTTESLLMELDNKRLKQVNLSLLQGTVSDFSELQRKYKWGTNMHYQYAANNNIHPTFVQVLLEDQRYDQYQALKILEVLGKEDNSTSFSHESLKSSIYNVDEPQEGSWDPKGFLEGEEIILVGGGSSVEKYHKKIIKHIKKENLKVIFLNINKIIPQDIGIATIVSHEIRAFLDASFYSEISHPLIIPMKTLGKVISKYIKDVELLDYGLNIKEGSMEIGEKSCLLDSSIVAGYALAVCTRAGAKRINLVGFDGFEEDDIRFEEMQKIFNQYTKLGESVDIVSLTPTKYAIKENIIDGK